MATQKQIQALAAHCKKQFVNHLETVGLTGEAGPEFPHRWVAKVNPMRSSFRLIWQDKPDFCAERIIDLPMP